MFISLQGGYDLTIGTSERGQNVDDLCNLPPFKYVHHMIKVGVFMGVVLCADMY